MRFLLLLFLIPSITHSQNSSVEELQSQQQQIEKQIQALQKSLDSINEVLAQFPIEEITEPMAAFAIKGADTFQRLHDEYPHTHYYLTRQEEDFIGLGITVPVISLMTIKKAVWLVTMQIPK